MLQLNENGQFTLLTGYVDQKPNDRWVYNLKNANGTVVKHSAQEFDSYDEAYITLTNGLERASELYHPAVGSRIGVVWPVEGEEEFLQVH